MRSLESRIDRTKRYHSPGDCDACRDEPCGTQFEIWDLEHELGRWKQQPLQEIEKEDSAKRFEDERFVHLTSSHADVLSRFVEIVERKITVDDYGDEVVSHLDNEITICLNKLKDREGGKRFGPPLQNRLREHLSEIFKQHHAKNIENKDRG